jgi:hypothetical protein
MSTAIAAEPKITKAQVTKAVLTVQELAPKAPGKSKLKAALSLIALFAGIAGAVIPEGRVKDVSDTVSAVVDALQRSGALVKDRAPVK